MRDFYAKLLATSAAADIHILSDENCCKLLAWLYAYGGGFEAVIFNGRLNEDIKHSQNLMLFLRCGIYSSFVLIDDKQCGHRNPFDVDSSNMPDKEVHEFIRKCEKCGVALFSL